MGPDGSAMVDAHDGEGDMAADAASAPSDASHDAQGEAGDAAGDSSDEHDGAGADSGTAIDAGDGASDSGADASSAGDAAADGATGAADAAADANATHDAGDLCGNGVIDPGEDCDPGASPPPNDGCHAPGSANECTFIVAPTSEDQCPGQAIALPTGSTILPESSGMSTYGFKDDYSGSCQGASGGRDRVFQVTPAVSGTITVKIGYETDGVTSTCSANPQAPDCWAAVLYARTTCSNAASELACAAGISAVDIVPAAISFAAVANTPYWVIVDGYDGSSYGPFTLEISLQ
jgi:hypothetical protein